MPVTPTISNVRPCIDIHPQPTPETCPVCYRFVYDERYKSIWTSDKPITIRPLKVLCVHVGKRIEVSNWKGGCVGLCSHKCDHPSWVKRRLFHPIAVPGGNCQTCPDYEPDS